MAESYAKPDSLPFITHYVQRRRKKRKSSLPVAVQRYFTDLTPAGGQYYSWSSNPVIDRLVFDVYSPTGSNSGLPAGIPEITANELQTVDFTYIGALPDIGYDGVNYFDGIVANIKAYDSGNNLLVDAPLDESWTNGNVAVNRAAVLGSERKGDFVIGKTGVVDDATYDPVTGAGTVVNINSLNRSFVDLSGLNIGDSFLFNITNTGSGNITVRTNSSGITLQTIGAGESLEFIATTQGIGNLRIQGAVGTQSFILNLVKQVPSTTPYATAENITDVDAELFTQDGGDWLGVDLVTNGDFSDGVNNWTVISPVTLNVVNGEAFIERNAGSVNNLPQQNITSTGNTYRTILDVISLSNSVSVFTGGVETITTDTGLFTLDETAGSDGKLRVGPTGATGATCTIDNVSTKRLLQTV